MIFARDKSQMCNNLFQLQISVFQDLSHLADRLWLVSPGKIHGSLEAVAYSQF